MAIDKITPNLTAATKPASSPALTENKQDKKPMIESEDSVSITQVAQSVKNALASSSGDSFIDADKIEQIRQAILDNRYVINAEQIANKLISLEKEFYNR
ncbi:MAG: flagellar biosynthesis anti-sigma factor FlgM [Gammaproteobacteria bacterium]